MQLDILVFAAHPDDAEISAGGTILKAVAAGHKVGVIDITRGELGSRGSAELRAVEAANASKVLGLSARENCGLRDGFFLQNEDSLLAMIRMIRTYQPKIVLCNAISDRHPDHGKASKLVSEACFYSGLLKIDTGQEKWRPGAVYHYVQDYYLKPDFVVDVTDFWDKKVEALRCYSSQFYDPNSTEPRTPISGKEFFDFLHARAMQMGRPAGFQLAEGFIADRTIGVNDITTLI